MRARMVLLAGLTTLAPSSGGCTDAIAPPAPTSPRVVSLVPVVAETIAALGRFDRVVAVSTYCQLPEAEGLPRVGTGLTPAYEAIARLRPTLVVTEQTSGTKERELERIAPTLALPWRTVAEAARGIQALGARLDAAAEAEVLAERFERALSTEAPPDGPVVLAVLASPADRLTSVWYVRSDSLHGAALSAAGLRSAMPDPPKGPPEMSLEALVALDPPSILVLGQELAEVEATRDQLARLDVLTATKAGRIRGLATPSLFHTGPDLLALVPRLQEAMALSSGGAR